MVFNVHKVAGNQFLNQNLHILLDNDDNLDEGTCELQIPLTDFGETLIPNQYIRKILLKYE